MHVQLCMTECMTVHVMLVMHQLDSCHALVQQLADLNPELTVQELVMYS